MNKTHFYSLTIQWTGNKGEGTTNYQAYERSHVISGENKPEISASSDPAFRGDKSKYNPEELLVASLAACHMLWFLHLCADNGVVVLEYIDNPKGSMTETEDGSGKFKEVTLNPIVTVAAPGMQEKVDKLHEMAGQRCFIAKSVNFPLHYKGVCIVAGTS